jgi:hypothetical protein
VSVSPWVWALFAALLLAAFAFDLGFLRRSRREQRELSVRDATIRSAAWIGLALVFALRVAAVLLSDFIEFPNHVSLAAIAAALSLSVMASIKWPGARPA